MDGKHVTISCPLNSGSLYYNYRGNYCIVLLATCDVLLATGVLWNSDFGQRLLNSNIDLPEDAQLPETRTTFSYFVVGDAVFPLKNCIMRPYPGL